MDNKKRGATPSCTSAADDVEETNPDPSSFETAPTDERRHDTYATCTSLPQSTTSIAFHCITLHIPQQGQDEGASVSST